MRGYEQYIEEVKSGKIITSMYIKQVVERFCEFREREDVYFDKAEVNKFIDFCSRMKHWVGPTAGQQFILLPWQEFFFAVILGLKWKSTGRRVVRETYLQVSRKSGKSSIIAALALYHLIADGEAAPFIACLASSRDQARLIFEMCQNYAKSIDPKGEHLKYFRNYMKMPANNGEIKIFSSDASRLDGLNVSLGIIDEFAVQPNIELYSKIRTSQGFRNQPLMVLITTPQADLTSPAFDTYRMSIEVLAKVKTDDTFWPFLYTLDPGEEDKWDDETLWIKSNPSIGNTITYDSLRADCVAAKNDTAKQVHFKTLQAGIWCQSHTVWIDEAIVASRMEPLTVEQFAGTPCAIGMDLGSVSDFTAISVMWRIEGKYYFKSWAFLPEASLEGHPDKLLYEKFIAEGTMIMTDGNCTNYDFICAKIGEISKICPVSAIYTDPWNATGTMIKLGEMGFNVVPFSQSIGHYSAPTKNMERIIRDNLAVIDKSSCTLFNFMNAELAVDHNGNQKVSKAKQRKKVDIVLAMTNALGGEEENGINQDWEIFVI